MAFNSLSSAKEKYSYGGANAGDDDDFSFGNRFSVKSSKPDPQEEENLKRIHERIGQVENDSLESTQRALRSLNEANEIGVKTAEELIRQGEKLDNINERLDDVDNTLYHTQKNLNQIKSIFGGLKNKFFKPKAPEPVPAPKASNDGKKDMKTSQSAQNFSAPVQPAKHAVITGSDREVEINKNLDEMSVGLSRLKGLASEMQFELDRQNPIIDSLNSKTSRTQSKIEDQNKQMRRVLQ